MKTVISVQRSFVVAAIFAAGIAGAQETRAPSRTTFVQPPVLNCPAGSVQKGGFNTPLEASVCIKKGTTLTFHGSYVQQWANGRSRAVGQYEDGFRTGHWQFFREDGSKEAEIDFARGDYNGKRIQFHANGQVKSEETWVKGKRQGLVREFDAKGNAVSAKEYRDDRAVATR